MVIAKSKVTAQGQISIPVDVRRKLGIGPGSTLEWDEEDGKILVKRSGTYSSLDIHRKLFPNGPPKPATVEEMDESIRQYIRKKYARR